jgi:hypothetical protein
MQTAFQRRQNCARNAYFVNSLGKLVIHRDFGIPVKGENHAMIVVIVT